MEEIPTVRKPTSEKTNITGKKIIINECMQVKPEIFNTETHQLAWGKKQTNISSKQAIKDNLQK